MHGGIILGEEVDGHYEGVFAFGGEVMAVSSKLKIGSEDGAMESRDTMLNELGHRVYNYLLYTLKLQLKALRKDCIAQQRWSSYFFLTVA